MVLMRGTRRHPRYFRPAEVEQLLGDPTKAREELGWEPKVKLWAALSCDAWSRAATLSPRSPRLSSVGTTTSGANDQAKQHGPDR